MAAAAARGAHPMTEVTLGPVASLVNAGAAGLLLVQIYLVFRRDKERDEHYWKLLEAHNQLVLDLFHSHQALTKECRDTMECHRADLIAFTRELADKVLRTGPDDGPPRAGGG
jgi:hypothetical protein